MPRSGGKLVLLRVAKSKFVLVVILCQLENQPPLSYRHPFTNPDSLTNMEGGIDIAIKVNAQIVAQIHFNAQRLPLAVSRSEGKDTAHGDRQIVIIQVH